MEALRAAIQDQPEGRLDVAALEIASIETPDLDPGPFLVVLDKIASGITAEVCRVGAAVSQAAARPTSPRRIIAVHK